MKFQRQRQETTLSFRWPLPALVVFVVSATSLHACGPSYYLARLNPAERAMERAEQAGAREHAPYLYWYAAAHLDKAREEAGESSYQEAARYAARAAEAAEAAEAVARRTRSRSTRGTEAASRAATMRRETPSETAPSSQEEARR